MQMMYKKQLIFCKLELLKWKSLKGCNNYWNLFKGLLLIMSQKIRLKLIDLISGWIKTMQLRIRLS